MYPDNRLPLTIAGLTVTIFGVALVLLGNRVVEYGLMPNAFEMLGLLAAAGGALLAVCAALARRTAAPGALGR